MCIWIVRKRERERERERECAYAFISNHIFCEKYARKSWGKSVCNDNYIMVYIYGKIKRIVREHVIIYIYEYRSREGEGQSERV